jgi:hypothetical protein
MGPEIETKRIFSLAMILMKLKICKLQIDNLNMLIFTSKNWPNDLRVGYYSAYVLIELIEAHVSSLKEYEDEFE